MRLSDLLLSRTSPQGWTDPADILGSIERNRPRHPLDERGPVMPRSPFESQHSAYGATSPNFFDQFDEDATPQPPARAAQAAPQIPPPAARAKPAPFPVAQELPPIPSVADNPGETDVERINPQTIKLRDDVAALFAQGAPREQIYARIRQDGLEPDAVAHLEDNLDFRDEHADYVPNVYVEKPAPLSEEEEFGKDKGRGESTLAGVADTVLVGANDKLSGLYFAGQESMANLYGTGNGKDFWTNYETIKGNIGDREEAAEHYHPGYYTGGQVAGAFMVPGLGQVGAEASLGRYAAKGAMEGALYNGAYGFNKTDGSWGDKLAGGAKGAALGAGLGVVASPLGYGAGRMAQNRADPGLGEQVLRAADRLNKKGAPEDAIAPLAGHVGGPIARHVHALNEPSIFGGVLSGLRGGSEAFRDNVGKAVHRVADDTAMGKALPLEDVAARVNDEALPGSMANFAERLSTVANQEYSAAARLAGDVRLTAPKTVQEMDRLIAKWQAVPGGVQGLDDLIELRAQLAGGDWTVDGLRRLRTEFGSKLEASSRTAREEAGKLWPALSRDIFGGLRQAGKVEAAKAYRQADQKYAANQRHLVAIRGVIGKGDDVSATSISERISRMSRNDVLKLRQAMTVMPIEMQNELRGALITNMGRKIASRATGDAEFSIESFATNWTKLSEEARHTLFPFAYLRGDLEALATLARADRRVRKLGNPSGTAMMINNVGELTAVGSAVLGGPVSWTPILMRWGGGALLARPGVARALVNVGKGGPGGSVEVVMRRLEQAARRNPAVSDSILGFSRDLRAVMLDPNAMAAQAGTAPITADVAPMAGGQNYFDQFDNGGEPETEAQAGSSPPNNPNLIIGPDGKTYDRETGVEIDVSGFQ